MRIKLADEVVEIRNLHKVWTKQTTEFFEKESFDGERIFRLCSFLIHEAVELQQETKWKWWKAPENYKIDYENRNVEIADLWHVLIQLSIEAGLTADDVMWHFNKKHEANIKRQEDRY